MHAWADDLARELARPRWLTALLIAAVALSLLAKRSNSARGY